MVNSLSLDQLAVALNSTLPRLFANNIRGFLYGGGKQAEPHPDALGLLPAWREATFHYIVNAGPGSTRHDYNIQGLDKYFPNAGAYVNEASPGEPRWKERFWGSHYPKLEGIKKKVDPKNVLWCSPCVGADMFTYDDERLCPNPKYPQAGPAPQTYRDDNSKTGIASLPGDPGIPNPMDVIVKGFMVNKTVPTSMPLSNFWKISMGQGGSVGGKWALGPGDSSTPTTGHGGMEHGGMAKANSNPAPSQMASGHSHSA